MKKLINCFAFIVFFFSFLNNSFCQSPPALPLKYGFHIGYHNFFNNNEGNSWSVLFSRFHDLNLNFMMNAGTHFETGQRYPDNTILEEGWLDPLGSDKANLSNLFSKWALIPGFADNNALLIEREKITRAAYGQLSDYQCESVPSNVHPRYGYEIRSGADYTETIGSEVISGIYSGSGGTESGGYYLVRRLYENLEQVDHPGIPPYHEDWQHNEIKGREHFDSDTKYDGYKWYIMPRMRISASDANSSIEKNVCRIDIVPYSGEANTKSINLTTKNFRKYDGTYNGEYLDHYYNTNGTLKEISILASVLNDGNHLENFPSGNVDARLIDHENINVDYRVFWYGNVNVYLDRVRVADDWAHSLFYPEYDTQFHFKSNIEAIFNDPLTGANPHFGYAYIDEYKYNIIPCIAKVNEYIKASGPAGNNSGLFVESNTAGIATGSGLFNVPDQDSVLNYLVTSKAVVDVLFKYMYTFVHRNYDGAHEPYPLISLPNNVSIETTPGTVDYTKAATPSAYNYELNYLLEHKFWNGWGENSCFLDHLKSAANLIKKYPQITFCAGTQSHSYEDGYASTQDPHPQENLREPTNEEIKLQNYLSMCYGARAILNYIFPTYTYYNDAHDKLYHDYGMEDVDPNNYYAHIKRTSNYYGQNKFDTVATLNQKLRNIGKIMYEDNSLKWEDSRTVDNHSLGADFKFISDLKDYDRNTVENTGGPKYWEIGAFTNDPAKNPYSTYFMLVNKRCTPELDNGLHEGDIRKITLKFDASDPAFAGFNNWKVIDALDSNVSVIFDKNSTGYIPIPGTFQPGEGRLLKLTPVMIAGGTLVTNETVNNPSFNVLNAVQSGGHNITLTGTGNISFADNTLLNMNGGSLIISGANNTSRITLKGNGTSKWNGVASINSASAYYQYVDFKDLNNGISAVFARNTSALTCSHCNFYCSQDASNHPNAVNIYTSGTNVSSNNLTYNNFFMSPAATYSVSLVSSTGNKSGLYMNYNNISTNSSTPAGTALILTECNATIKNSVISGYSNSITALASDVGLAYNVFTSSGDGSAITAASNSNLNLALIDRTRIAGVNTFLYATPTDPMNCINLNASTFNMAQGDNNFHISNDPSNFHILGTINAADDGMIITCADLTGNCFYNEDAYSIMPVTDLYTTTGSPVPICYTMSEDCDPHPDGEIAFMNDLGDGIVDTVYKVDDGEGNGGGEPANGMKLINKKDGQQLGAAYRLYSSIELNFRKRSMDSVYNSCYFYLDNYFDSAMTSTAVSRLVSSAAALDKDHPLQDQNRIAMLKTYYEGLILTHSDNEKMIKTLFYYIQKIKMTLEDYQSAMSGFQQIINQNPYSYEGLVASWDYMSAYLLSIDSNGTGGGERILLQSKEECFSDDPVTKSQPIVIRDDFDKKKYNTEQRTQITKTITSVLTKTKKTADDEIKQLKTNADNGDKKSKRILEEKKLLKESVKIKRPADNNELAQILNDDTKKIFHKDRSGSDKDDKALSNIIPLEYKLNQNYPNPFNPVTKISFSIPVDSKVKLIVYDILGREVIRLINDELRQPGNYMMEFNGTQLASGIYFYRLVAEGSKNFTQVKKMVLVK